MSDASDSDLEDINENHTNDWGLYVGELFKDDIFKAIANNDAPFVKELLTDTYCIFAQNSNGNTPVHVAIVNGSEEVLYLLLEELESANIDILNAARETPLHIAARYGRISFGEALITRGADILARDGFGFTPLHRACYNSQLDFVRLLLRYNADVSVKCDFGLTPFMVAINNAGNPGIAFELLEKDVCLNDVTTNGCSVLLLAANSQHPIAFKLIERGANVNHVTASGHSALELALFWPDSGLYYKILTKFDRRLLNYEFFYSFFTKCKFPDEQWAFCAICLLNCDISSKLLGRYFRTKPNDWVSCFSRNIPAEVRVELISKFLSLDVPLAIEDAFFLLCTYGFGKEMECVIQSNMPCIRYDSSSNCRYNKILICPVFYGAIFIHEDLKELVNTLFLWNGNSHETFEEFPNILKFLDLRQSSVPSLVELSRDASRNLIKNSCVFNGGSLVYHQFLNSLPLPQIIKDIIKLQVPLYF